MTEKTKLILKLVEDKRITVYEAGILLEPEPQPLQWYPYYSDYSPRIFTTNENGATIYGHRVHQSTTSEA